MTRETSRAPSQLALLPIILYLTISKRVTVRPSVAVALTSMLWSIQRMPEAPSIQPRASCELLTLARIWALSAVASTRTSTVCEFAE